MTVAEGVKYVLPNSLWLQRERKYMYIERCIFNGSHIHVYIHAYDRISFRRVHTRAQKVDHLADNVNNYLVDNNRCAQLMQIDVCEHIRTCYRSINYSYLCCRCRPGNITFLAPVVCTCIRTHRGIRVIGAEFTSSGFYASNNNENQTDTLYGFFEHPLENTVQWISIVVTFLSSLAPLCCSRAIMYYSNERRNALKKKGYTARGKVSK